MFICLRESLKRKSWLRINSVRFSISSLCSDVSFSIILRSALSDSRLIFSIDESNRLPSVALNQEISKL